MTGLISAHPLPATREESLALVASVAPAIRRAQLTRRLHLLVIAGHPVVQQGLRSFMRRAEQIRVIDQAVSGHDGVAVARRSRPDVILLDAWLEDMTFEDAVRHLGAVSPGSRVIALAAQPTPFLRDEAARLGVQGLLGLDVEPDRLLEAIAHVAAGRVIADAARDEIPRILRRAAEKLNVTPLTPREHEILRRAARGESNAEIAKAIHLAPTTVKSYLQNALRKLNCRNRVEAVFMLSELRIL